jgi:hypothetical protein
MLGNKMGLALTKMIISVLFIEHMNLENVYKLKSIIER